MPSVVVGRLCGDVYLRLHLCLFIILHSTQSFAIEYTVSAVLRILFKLFTIHSHTLRTFALSHTQRRSIVHSHIDQRPLLICAVAETKDMRFFGFARVICSAAVVMAKYIIYSTHTRTRTQPSPRWMSISIHSPQDIFAYLLCADTKRIRSPGDALCVHGFLFHREQSAGDVTFRFSRPKILMES